MVIVGLVLAIALGVLLPAVISALSIRHRRGWIAGLMGVGCLIGLVVNNAASNAPSFEAIDNMVLSAFVFGPALAGTLAGAAFGWWKWRRNDG